MEFQKRTGGVGRRSKKRNLMETCRPKATNAGLGIAPVKTIKLLDNHLVINRLRPVGGSDGGSESRKQRPRVPVSPQSSLDSVQRANSKGSIHRTVKIWRCNLAYFCHPVPLREAQVPVWKERADGRDHAVRRVPRSRTCQADCKEQAVTGINDYRRAPAAGQFVPLSSFRRKRESTPNIAVAFRTRPRKWIVLSMDPRFRRNDGGEQCYRTSN